MNNLRIEFRYVSREAEEVYESSGPIRPATDGSAGVDLRAVILDNYGNPSSIDLWPGNKRVVGTGIAIHINDPGYVGLVFPRSGLAVNAGVSLANAVGVIDSDYQGEIKVALHNSSGEDLAIIYHGDRIAQLVIVPVVRFEPVRVEEFSETTKRGSGGFGSTGRN